MKKNVFYIPIAEVREGMLPPDNGVHSRQKAAHTANGEPGPLPNPSTTVERFGSPPSGVQNNTGWLII